MIGQLQTIVNNFCNLKIDAKAANKKLRDTIKHAPNEFVRSHVQTLAQLGICRHQSRPHSFEERQVSLISHHLRALLKLFPGWRFYAQKGGVFGQQPRVCLPDTASPTAIELPSKLQEKLETIKFIYPGWTFSVEGISVEGVERVVFRCTHVLCYDG